MRSPRALSALLFAPLLLGAAGKPAGLAPPRVEVRPSTIEATGDFAWAFQIFVANPGPLGIYSDSVLVTVEDRGAGETRQPRTQRIPMGAAAASIGDVSGADSVEVGQTAPASCESGVMRFRYFGHRADGTHVVADAPPVTLTPGPLSLEHPSEFLSVGGKKVEVVSFSAASPGAPGLLLVHDHGAHARRLLSFGPQLSARGYNVMFMSLPGYGQSDGPADFAGPRSVEAVGAALDRLKRAAGVDSTRLAAWGVGRGANAVLGAAARRSDLAVVVAQSALYDLPAAMRGAPPAELKAAILAEAGKDSAAWIERSPMRWAPKLRAATRIVHGGADREAPFEQAQAFAASLAAAGDSVSTFFFPGSGHLLSRPEMQRSTLPSLDALLHVRR